MNALAANNKLKMLNLEKNGQSSGKDWAFIFQRALQLVCERSSISSTIHLSHSLSSLAGPYGPSHLELVEGLPQLTPYRFWTAGPS